MKRSLLVSMSLLMLFLSSCGTLFVKGGADYRDGENLLKQGRFDEAAAKALTALDKNPEFEEAADLLDRAVNEGTQKIPSQIEGMKSSNDPFVYDRILPLYQRMENLHQIVSASSYASQYKTKSWEAEIQESLQKAAEAHYAAGRELLAKGDYRSARNATAQFEAVQKFVPDYKDVAALTEQSIAAGVATAVVYLKQPISGSNLEEYAQKILVNDAAVKKFTRFISSREAGLSAGLSADAAAARAKGSADFLIYVGDFTIAGEAKPLRRVEAETTVKNGFINAQFPATQISASFELTASAPFAVYDTASGEALQNDTISVDAGDYATYYVFNANENRDLLGRNCRSINMPEPEGLSLFREFFEEIEDQTYDFSREDPNQLKNMSFSYIKNLVHKKTFFGNPEIMYVENNFTTSLYYSLDGYGDENQEVADNADLLLNSVIPATLEKRAQEQANDREGAAKLVVARAANAAKSALR